MSIEDGRIISVSEEGAEIEVIMDSTSSVVEEVEEETSLPVISETTEGLRPACIG